KPASPPQLPSNDVSLEPLPTRKRMLVPLNRPSASPRRVGVGVKTVNVIVRAISFVFKVCFGWLGWILSRYVDRNFEAEVRSELYFLFEGYGARIIPSTRSHYATTVTIEFSNVRL